MSQEGIELRRLERILSELARPTLHHESITLSTRVAMMQIGLVVSGQASRRDLIERLWGRKRTLLRRLSLVGDRGPMQPVA
jgi:hypothetical protein